MFEEMQRRLPFELQIEVLAHLSHDEAECLGRIHSISSDARRRFLLACEKRRPETFVRVPGESVGVSSIATAA